MAEKLLAMPYADFKLGESFRFQILEAFRKASRKKEGRAEANTECVVADHRNPEDPFLLTVPAIMESELNTNYPDKKYVGKHFELTRFAKTGGGKASPIRLKEIDAPKPEKRG